MLKIMLGDSSKILQQRNLSQINTDAKIYPADNVQTCKIWAATQQGIIPLTSLRNYLCLIGIVTHYIIQQSQLGSNTYMYYMCISSL